MALVAGTTTVDETGTASGTGLSWALFQARLAIATANNTIPDPNNPPPEMTEITQADGSKMHIPPTQKLIDDLTQGRIKTLKGMADSANGDASGIVTYLLANATIDLSGAHAVIGITTSTGQIPSSLAPGTPITPPIFPESLPLTGTGTLT